METKEEQRAMDIEKKKIGFAEYKDDVDDDDYDRPRNRANLIVRKKSLY